MILFVSQLIESLENHRNTENAAPMSKYMKDKFPFLGIKSVLRKSLLRDVINDNKNEIKPIVKDITTVLYSLKEREYHYCGMEIFARFKKGNYIPSDINDIKYLIITNSHWDSVDFIAKHILGQFLRENSDCLDKVISEFSNHKNMWLNRSAILFQLGYKKNTNADLLFQLCNQHRKSNEFFIQKAIGWALREYSKVNSKAVLEFVGSTTLKPLSKREAIRLIV